MSETMHNISVAYTKGVKANVTSRGRISIAKCPYGETKLELRHWWHSGFYDRSNNSVDNSLILTKGDDNVCI